MSEIWPHFTKEHPCPACGKHSWTCRAGEKKFICQRVESNHPARDGGWYHEYGQSTLVPSYTLPKRKVVKINNVSFDDLIYQQSKNTRAPQIEFLASKLFVSPSSLIDLNVCRHWNDGEWQIPMRDGDNKIIGIHLRCDDGSKKAVVGSRNGLFCPQGIEPQKIAYICEGASNTAALLTMGFYALGRPSCNTGADMLKVALKRLGISRVVIIADNDSLKFRPAGCGTFRPGQDGAKKLKKELGLMSVIFTTPNPCKDVRQLLQKLGVESARDYINNSVAGKVWTKV